MNSFLAIDKAASPKTVSYMQAKYPEVSYTFRPSLIAFDLKYITHIAGELFEWLEKKDVRQISRLTFDASEGEIFVSIGSNPFLKMIRGLESDHIRLSMELMRFPGPVYWPARIQEAMKNLPENQIN